MRTNTGHYNSGNRNSGSYNSGNRNSGNYNSGDCNSGNYNSGNRNSGDCNTGNYNSGDLNTGYFNTDEPTVRLFNEDTGLKRSEIDIPYIELPITEMVDGKLVTRSYKEAWKIAWDNLGFRTRHKFKNLPNFCPDIFEEITGIRVKETRTIVIDGKSIQISKESFEELKNSLIE